MLTLRVVHSYLTNRWQRTKIDKSYSFWEEVLSGKPQGFILESLSFNIFLCEFFLIMQENDFSRYADHNGSYRTADTIDKVIKLPERVSMMLFKWLYDNQIKANINKCPLQVNKKDEVVINLGETEIKNSEYGKLLGMNFDKRLNFNEHLNNVISKASYKVNVLSKAGRFTKSVFPGSESIPYFVPKTCNVAPLELIESINLNAFKNVITKWQPKNCSCRLCKQYGSYLGFIRSTCF